MEPWQYTQGEAIDRVVTLAAEGGAAIPEGTYSGSETLELEVSVGDDRAPETLADAAATWEDAAANEVAVLVPHAATAALTPGPYRLNVWLTTGGRRYLAHRAFVEILPAAGAAGPPPTYCTLDLVRRLLPAAGQLVADAPWMQSDLAEPRAEARAWLDRQLLARARRDLEELAGGRLAATEAERALAALLADAGGDVEAALATIRGHLADDRLADPDGAVALAAAHYAVHWCCRPQLGAGPDETTWQALGMLHLAEARRVLRGCHLRVEPEDADPLVFAP